MQSMRRITVLLVLALLSTCEAFRINSNHGLARAIPKVNTMNKYRSKPQEHATHTHQVQGPLTVLHATTTTTDSVGTEAVNIASATPAATDSKAVAKDVPAKTVKKLLPLGLMLFFILFNYTILRDTKDVLVVTAPGGGAEIIPFLKTYVNLPSAIWFTIVYGSLSNKMSADKVFYVVMASFLAFFSAFAGFICKPPAPLPL